MATLMHILAHPNPEHSLTTSISDAFLERYGELHPDDTIVTLNLYHEHLGNLTATHISAMGKGGDAAKMTPEETQAWSEIIERIRQFCDTDKFLVTAPMWNFSVPAILKTYIDLVMQAGYTFRYTEIGTPVGLMAGKRMVIVSSRGGVYSQPPMSSHEMCVTYLRHVFGFLGIEIVGELVAEGLALVGPQDQRAIVQGVAVKAREMAETF